MKKNILKFASAVVIAFLLPCMVNAQEENDFKNSTPEQRAHFQAEWMKTELALDSTLVPVVYNLNLKYAQKNQTAMSSEGSKMQEYKTLKASSDAKDSELKKIFTKDQYKIYEQKKEEMKKKMK